jgi:hypothetical protein
MTAATSPQSENSLVSSRPTLENRGGARDVDHQFRSVCALGHDRRCNAVGLFPSHRLAGRPDLPDVEVRDRDRKEVPGQSLRAPLQRRIAVLQGERDIEHIAHLQALGLQRRREHAIQRRQLQVGFAAQHGEGLTGSEHVDHLVAAQDVHLVHRQGVGLGVPGQSDRAGL